MQIVTLGELSLAPITQFESFGAASAEWAAGEGAAHVHTVRFGAGGEIGPHVAGFGQLFAPIVGSGWVSAGDGVRHPIGVGQVARCGAPRALAPAPRQLDVRPSSHAARSPSTGG